MTILTQQETADAIAHYELLLSELTIGDACPELRAELQEALGLPLARLRAGHIMPETGMIDVDDDYRELAEAAAMIGAQFDQCVDPETRSSAWPIVGVFGALGAVLVWDLLRKR